MSWSVVRVGAVALVTLLAFAAVVAAQPETRSPQRAVSIEHEEWFSADDIKDVFEAIQFIMFSLGVGAALYWFWCHYLPSKDNPRIEFDVDVGHIGQNDETWFIELVAIVKNHGCKKAELTELRFALESIVPDSLSSQAGALASLKALTPLCSGEWVPATFVLDSGTQSRRAVAVAIPKTFDQINVTAHVRNVKRIELYTASKLVRLIRRLN